MIKSAVKSALATSAGWRLSARLRHGGVVVLMYHRIADGDSVFGGLSLQLFRSQMQWLKKHCTPIWAEDIFDAARRVDRIRPPVVITFDDGYRNYHDCAYPVLRELRIPATVFLSTEFMDHGGLIWPEKVHWAVINTTKPSATLPWNPQRTLPLASMRDRLAFIAECKAHLKVIPEDELRRHVVQLVADLDAPDPEQRVGRQMLSWDEVRAAREGTRFGGHSHTHPILSRLPAEGVEWEIRTCRDRIAAETGERPTTFAYPNGRQIDFNEVTKEALRRNGFEIAFSTVEGIVQPGADRLELKRIAPWGTSLGDFASVVGLVASRNLAAQ